MDDAVLMHRLHFGFTITYHYFFPQVTVATRQDLLRGRRPALSLAVVARGDVDAVLVPDHPGPHADLADRVLEVLDQLGWIESVF